MASKPVQEFDLDATVKVIADELRLPIRQVNAAVDLLNAGNTIPFIARYRKEATGGLDEVKLRAIEDALEHAIALAARKVTVLHTIDEQGLLSGELRTLIEDCKTIRELEAIYLPFKPKRRTRAAIARERGLQPLADLIVRQETLAGSKQQTLAKYVSIQNDVPDSDAALQGAGHHRRAMVRRVGDTQLDDQQRAGRRSGDLEDQAWEEGRSGQVRTLF